MPVTFTSYLIDSPPSTINDPTPVAAVSIGGTSSPPERIALKPSDGSFSCANAKFICANENETKGIATVSASTSIFGLYIANR
ncbi:MAG: hypothetical protein QOK90_08040 [Nitrososphaeraceae archaeon]|nr:hypothetical protein [Nitrososphaeraceae archaeon]